MKRTLKINFRVVVDDDDHIRVVWIYTRTHVICRDIVDVWRFANRLKCDSWANGGGGGQPWGITLMHTHRLRAEYQTMSVRSRNSNYIVT